MSIYVWAGTTDGDRGKAANWLVGGVPASVVPTLNDDVTFDGAASTYTITLSASISYFKSLDTTGAGANPVSISGTSKYLQAYGNITLKSNDTLGSFGGAPG